MYKKALIAAFLLAEMLLAQTAMAQGTAGDYSNAGVSNQIKEFLCAPTEPDPATNAFIGNTSGTSEQLSYEAGNRNVAKNDLYRCINQLYKFAVVLGSVIGTLFIVIAGYMYMSAGGNKESVDKAKDIIVTTLSSLVILFIGYVLLRALNPDLVKFPDIQPPSVRVNQAASPQELAQQVQQQVQAGLIPDEGSGGGNTALVATYGPKGCSDPCADYSSQFKYNNSQKPGQNTYLNTKVIDFLNQVKINYPNFIVTEAFPPTVNHADSCHFNGTCADMAAAGSTVLEVSKLCKAIESAKQQSGYSVTILNEYPESMNPIPGCGIAAKQYKTTTGGHFHIKVN